MAQVGSMYASLSLESASFMSGMKKAAAETSTTAAAIKANLAGITTAVQGLGVVLAVSMFAQRTKEALDYADAIADLSDRTGASTKFIQEFGYAAQMAGSDVDTSRTAVEKFAKLVGEAANGSESARAKLQEYGITALDVDKAIGQASDAISKMDSPTKQLAATTDLFGKKASTLTQTLAGGTKGLELQARAARDLGIVLSDDLVRNAGQANDKLDTMKQITDARMASMISKNAESIVSLANAFTDLKGALLGFWGQNPQGALTLIGALAGAAVGFKIAGGTGALVGGGIGAVGGFVSGGVLTRSQREGSPDLSIRTQELNYVRGQYEKAKRENNIAAQNTWRPQLLKEMERMGRAQEAARAAVAPKPVPGSTDTGTIPLPKTPGGGTAKSGPSAADIALKEAERAARLAQDVARNQLDILRAGGIYDNDNDLDYYKKLAKQTNPSETDDIVVTGSLLDRNSRERQEAMLGGDLDIRHENTRKEIQGRYDEQLAQLELSVKRGEIKAGSEEETLRAQFLYQKLLEENAADWDHRVARDRQLAETELTQLGIQKDTLTLQGDLARTTAERRRILLKILDLEMKERDQKLAQQQIGLGKDTSEYRNIQSQRDALASQGGQLRDQTLRSTMGPLESFLDAIPASAEEANEALQNIAVSGLSALNDGIVDAIMGAKSFGEAFQEVGKMVVKALLNMAIQMAIIQPLTNMLGPVFGLPAKANGGLSSGGWTIVGERGPEVVELPGGSNVIPNGALRSVSGRGGGQVINIDARGSTDEALVKSMVIQGIAQAMPQIKQSAHQHTMNQIGRPRM